MVNFCKVIFVVADMGYILEQLMKDIFFYEVEIGYLQLELMCGDHSEYGRGQISARIRSLRIALFVKQRFAEMVKYNTRSHAAVMLLRRTVSLSSVVKFRPLASGN